MDQYASNTQSTLYSVRVKVNVTLFCFLGPATTLYIMDKIANDKEGQQLLKSFDFYFVPVINPDGMVHYPRTFFRCKNVDFNPKFVQDMNIHIRGIDSGEKLDLIMETAEVWILIEIGQAGLNIHIGIDILYIYRLWDFLIKE